MQPVIDITFKDFYGNMAIEFNRNKDFINGIVGGNDNLNYNLQKIVQGGGIDSDLNETGYLQGQKFFQRYKDIPFEAIYCSGLKRTRQTLKSFEDAGRSITPLAGLNEMEHLGFSSSLIVGIKTSLKQIKG